MKNGRIYALILAVVMVFGLIPAVYAVQAPGYRLTGKTVAGGYDLEITVPGVDATGGQLALQ